MFYDKSDKDHEAEWKQVRMLAEEKVVEFEDALLDIAGDEDDLSTFLEPTQASDEGPASGWSPFTRDYERAIIHNVWEFAEIVSGIDSVLWRKDEFGEWIHRPDYGKRQSKFGWDIFDPGVGRHSQGVYAMRPMQWENYADQFSSSGG